MKHLTLSIFALLLALSSRAADLATKAYVTNQIAIATNAIPVPDVSAQIAAATNGLLRSESDPVFAEWRDGYTQVNWAVGAERANSAELSERAGEAFGLSTETADDERSTEEIFRQMDNNTTAITNLQAEASLVSRLFSSTNVVAEVTNYNSTVHAPTLRLLSLQGTNLTEYVQVWSETNNLAKVAKAATNYTDVATNNLRDVFAPRAWSETTSGLGADAPAGVTWISTPQTVFAGGWEFEKILETDGGGYWVLKNNGLSQNVNTNGYMSLQASDGTEILSIEKTGSVLVGCDASAIDINRTRESIKIPVPVVSSKAPNARFAASLSGSWLKEEEGRTDEWTFFGGNRGCYLESVSWTGTSGNWVCEFLWTGLPEQFFCYFEYLQEGGAKVTHKAVYNPEGGILCTDGVHKVRPVYNNGTVTWQLF